MRWALWPVAVLVAVAVSGCAALGGAGAPIGTIARAERTHGRPAPSRPEHALPGWAPPGRPAPSRPEHALPGWAPPERPTPSRPEHALPGWATPEQAVRAFAAAYINWTAATVSARLRALARCSVGQARALLELQSREVAGDAELHRGKIANAGTVESVGPLHDSPDRYAVVTRERTGAAADPAYRGLAPAWHVSVATVTRAGRRWVLSGWQPEG
jgi:hypothetical protein